MKLFGVIFGVFGILLLAVGTGFYFYNANLLAQATVTKGVVVKNLGGGGYRGHYRPLVSFYDLNGQHHEFLSRSESSPAEYQQGEEVTVLYSQDDPKSAKIKDWFSLWGTATIFIGLGALILGIPIIIIAAIKSGLITVVNDQESTS